MKIKEIKGDTGEVEIEMVIPETDLEAEVIRLACKLSIDNERKRNPEIFEKSNFTVRLCRINDVISPTFFHLPDDYGVPTTPPTPLPPPPPPVPVDSYDRGIFSN